MPICLADCADTLPASGSARVSEMLDYSAEELTGRSLYTLCHGADAHLLRKAHVDREYPGTSPGGGDASHPARRRRRAGRPGEPAAGVCLRAAGVDMQRRARCRQFTPVSC